MSYYNGKRSLNVPRNHVIHFPETSPHLDWWASKLLSDSVTTQQLVAMPDHSVANLFAVCASIRREERTQCKQVHIHLRWILITCAANGELKTVAVWTMADEHGTIEVRDWSGATYKDSDYVDNTVRLRRVRVSSASATGVKIAEFMPGCNGTKFMVAPRHAMMRWWLGDKHAQ